MELFSFVNEVLLLILLAVNNYINYQILYFI